VEPVKPLSLEALVSEASDTRRRPSRAACPHCGQLPARPKRLRASTSDEDYRKSMLRMINAYTRRIELSGVAALADAVALRDALDLVIDTGVDICRSSLWSASWAEIGTATNMTRQSAQHRWGILGGARKVGGQPANLR
jgi:hypothetical protein